MEMGATEPEGMRWAPMTGGMPLPHLLRGMTLMRGLSGCLSSASGSTGRLAVRLVSPFSPLPLLFPLPLPFTRPLPLLRTPLPVRVAWRLNTAGQAPLLSALQTFPVEGFY